MAAPPDNGKSISVFSSRAPFDLINPENTIEAALNSLVEQGRLKSGVTVVIIGSILVGEQIVDAMQMRVV
jgi:hypothetical protein